MTLELGGNDPAIVLPDVDAKALAPEIFWAAFQNNAQFCNATKRLYVHEDVYDEVRDALVEFIEQNIKVGDGAEADTHLGPIQNSMQYGKVQDYFKDCQDNGHVFAVGGEIDDSAAGWFVPVTLVDNPPEDSRIVQEEPFRPILPLLKWSDEADNDCSGKRYDLRIGCVGMGYGSGGSRAHWQPIRGGTVWLNEVHQYSPFQAFGGHKQSGLGCENSLHGLMEYTNWQTITMNKNIG